MGNFYVNIIAKTTAKDTVSFLKSKGSSAYVMPTGEQECVIYEEQCDTQDIAYMYKLLQELTADKDCSALGVLNHDDDMLFLVLWNKGEHQVDFTIGYGPEDMDMNYELDEEGVPIGWSEETEEEKAIKETEKYEQGKVMANALSKIFEVADTQAILEVLTQDFVFAVEIHSNLAEVLALPDASIGLGYNYIEDGQADDELDMDQLIKIDG